jgi:type I restriction enzyme M protein
MKLVGPLSLNFHIARAIPLPLSKSSGTAATSCGMTVSPTVTNVEQLTFLLFLKMADEQSRPPFNKPSPIPKGKDWPALLAKDGDELEIHYRHTLEVLGKRSAMLGVIFRKAQNKIQDPVKLRRLIVDLIDKEQWSNLSADVKATPTRACCKRTPRT